MIHKHVTKRELLRNTKQNFPQSHNEVVTVFDNGLPMYSLRMNQVTFTSQAEPDKTFNITKDQEGKVQIHDHKEK